ncbi:MAG: type 1 glutamine amidotransferase [Planctomycetota bacterium]
MSVIVFQHWDAGSPRRLGRTLRDHGHKLDIRRLDQGDPIPPDLDNVRGLLVMGGHQNVGDEPWMSHEMDFIRKCHEAELPVFGICLGHQLIASALGGEAGPMEKPEFGFEDVSVGVPGQTDILLAGVPWKTKFFQAHGWEVKKAPADAQVLAGNDACKVQIMRAGVRTVSCQFHFEADKACIAELTERWPDGVEGAGKDPELILKEIDAYYDRFASVADRLCVNLATHCFPFASLTAI